MAKKLIYQLYPIAWEHLGGINAMTAHLNRLATLGVDYVWMSPPYLSTRYDHGYDIVDYYTIDDRLGTLEDMHHFIATAHQYGIKVLLDLVLNHTSIYHSWFRNRPEYYCWSEIDRPGWKNLFSGGPAWSFAHDQKQYYLHLFDSCQPDLNWFPDGRLNQASVQEFRRIVNFWLGDYGVDGFRLDCPQALNKDLTSASCDFGSLLSGTRAMTVINAIFAGGNHPRTLDGHRPFLIVELFDPNFGELTNFYARHTAINLVLNVSLKSAIDDSPKRFFQYLHRAAKSPNFMLELESHDAPRFTSRTGLFPHEILELMFKSGAQAICLYQGQELGLCNPTPEELPDDLLCVLDAETRLRHARGEQLDDLRPFSRANARVPLPLATYNQQERDPSSTFYLTRNWIHIWKNFRVL